MKSKEIKEHVEEQGYIHLNVLFEVVGNPKEHVEEMIKKVMEGIKNNKKIKVIKEDFAEAEDAGEGLWGTFCETELLVQDINTMTWIAFNFSPASIEVLAPKETLIKDKDWNEFLGELISVIHQSNMNSIQAKSKSKELLINFNALMRNAVLISLKEGEKTAQEIGKSIGIEEKGIMPVLEAMIKEKTLENRGDKYAKK